VGIFRRVKTELRAAFIYPS